MKKINSILLIILGFLLVGCTTTPTTQNEPLSVETTEDESRGINSVEIQEIEKIEETSNKEEVVENLETQELNQDSEDTKENSEIKEGIIEDKPEILFKNSYRDFNEEEYNLAKNSNYYVVLDFYSNWCPSCKTEDKLLESSFNNLENIVIFRVNHGDSDTSDFEEQLAEEFSISNRASGVILKSGEEVSRYSGHKSKSQYEEIFNSLN